MRIAGCLLALLMLTGGLATADPDERTPFDAVRWTATGPEVQVAGTWYELVALDGLPRARIIEACRKLDRRGWKKRFNEDLVAALATVGHHMGPTVDLTVRAPGATTTKVLRGVAATSAKRSAVRDTRSWKKAATEAVKRIKRAHAKKPHPDFAFLTIRHHGEAGPRLSPQQAHEDLDQLEWHVEHEFSYRDLRTFDRRAAFDTVRVGIGAKGIANPDFHIQLRKLVALFGDGHARVRGVAGALPAGSLPFAFIDVDERVAAVWEGGKPYEEGYPYIESIAGVGVEAWIAAAARLNAYGSPAFRRRQALRVAPLFRFVVGELRKPDARIEVVWRGDGGTKTYAYEKLHDRPIRFRPGRIQSGTTLYGGVGYVAIRSMSADPQPIVEQVLKFDKAPGLIIDVRGNGGGRRDILRAMLPHLMPVDAEPLVCNVASYRLPPGEVFDPAQGNLANRYLYPAGSRGLTEAENAVATPLLGALGTKLGFPRAGFTPLHAMVVSPAPKGAKRFLGPIALLIDGGCFSATDIFVGALEQLPNVTLIGTTTGGGSGRAQQIRLAHSRLDVRLSTMMSFRPNGRLYDGLGIEPDIEAQPPLKKPRAGLTAIHRVALEHLNKQLGK